MESEGELCASKFRFLLTGAVESHAMVPKPADWITPQQWDNILELAELPGFGKLPTDLESGIKRYVCARGMLKVVGAYVFPVVSLCVCVSEAVQGAGR